jgi:hypothetical protein
MNSLHEADRARDCTRTHYKMPFTKIKAPEQYRATVEELQRLESAREGTADFERRQESAAAMHGYEFQHIADPVCRPGHPGLEQY